MAIIRTFGRNMKTDIERFCAGLPSLPDNAIEEECSRAKKQKEWNLKEVNLSKPVYEYFTGLGYKAIAEFHNHDWIFWKDKKIICVELKKAFCKKVLRQCDYSYFANKVYAALGTIPTKKSIETVKTYRCYSQIGLMSIQNNEVKIIIEAGEREPVLQDEILKEIEKYHNLYGNSEAESAGKPNLLGTGPAKNCLKEIMEYLNGMPDAGWKEIYANVPSHYSNYKSMQCAMSKWQGFSLSEYKKELKIRG